MHLLVLEHQAALVTGVALRALVLHHGRLHRGHRGDARRGDGLNDVVPLDGEVHHRLSVLKVLGVDGDSVNCVDVPVQGGHIADGELDVVDEVGEVPVHLDGVHGDCRRLRGGYFDNFWGVK